MKDYPGVQKKGQKYLVQFRVKNKCVNGGYYNTPQEAHDVYLQMTAERNKEYINVVDFIEGEEWREIAGFSGRYWVSNMGRVKNINYMHTGEASLMTATKQISGGYYKVHLRPRILPVHRLVWIAFKGEIPSHLQINHIDFDKSNNKLDNLEMIFARENQSHSQQKIHNKTMVGCFFQKSMNKWCAQLSVHGVQRMLGYFITQEEAHERYLKEVALIGETNKYSYA